MHRYNQLSVLLPIKGAIKGKKAQIKNQKTQCSVLLPFSPETTGQAVMSEHKLFPFNAVPPVLVGDPEAVLGGSLWGPRGSPAILSTPRSPTRCSNFGVDSFESMWGRCLLCRHQQPVAEPQQSNRSPPERCTEGSAKRTQQKAADQHPPMLPPARSSGYAELILNPFLWRTGSCSN